MQGMIKEISEGGKSGAVSHPLVYSGASIHSPTEQCHLLNEKKEQETK